jgi:hypothetical protein
LADIRLQDNSSLRKDSSHEIPKVKMTFNQRCRAGTASFEVEPEPELELQRDAAPALFLTAPNLMFNIERLSKNFTKCINFILFLFMSTTIGII